MRKDNEMNITESEEPFEFTAKTCRCRSDGRKITYIFVESYHDLSKGKKTIIMSEILACERLRNYAMDELDAHAIETEIAELKMMLDLLP